MDWKHPDAVLRATILHGEPLCRLCVHYHDNPNHVHLAEDDYVCCFWGKRSEEIGFTAYDEANGPAELKSGFHPNSSCLEFNDGLETS